MREQQQHTFSTHDGVELFYRHWPATAGAGPRKAILLFHRGHEHSGRIAHLVDELGLPEFDFFAWDARGHGQSPGERGDARAARQASGAPVDHRPRPACRASVSAETNAPRLPGAAMAKPVETSSRFTSMPPAATAS